VNVGSKVRNPFPDVGGSVSSIIQRQPVEEPFRKYIAPNFEAEYLILVTNQLGPNKVSIYAFGKGPASAATQPATQPK